MSSCAQACRTDKACDDRASSAVRALSGDTVKQNVVQESTGPLVSGNEVKKDLNLTGALSSSRSGNIENCSNEKLLRKKRKRMVKKPFINESKKFDKDISNLKNLIRKKKNQKDISTIKKYIEREAAEEDSNGDIVEPEEEEENENEYDLNDSFIDDTPVDDDRNLYIAEKTEEKKERFSEFSIGLSKETILNNLKLSNLSNKKTIFNDIYRNQFNLYMSSILSSFNFIYDSKEVPFNFNHSVNWWYQILYFYSFLLDFKGLRFDPTVTDLLVVEEIEEDLVTNFNMIILKTIDRDFTCLIILCYLLKSDFVPVPRYGKFYYDIIYSILPILPPQDIIFTIRINPGQDIVKTEKVNLLNYEEVEKKFFDFYSNKSSSYDSDQIRKKNIDLQEKKDKIRFTNEYLNKVQHQLLCIGNDFKLDDCFDNDFSVVDNISKMFAVNKKVDSKCFGFVVYMEKNDYKNDPSEFVVNETLHISHLLPVMLKGVLFYLKTYLGKKKLKEIIVAHEHGDVNKKCHIQGFIEFQQRINLKLLPGSFYIRNVNDNTFQKYLIMFQSAKFSKKLQEYVLKKDDLVPVNKAYVHNFKNTVAEEFNNFVLHEGDDVLNPNVDSNLDSNQKKLDFYNYILNQPGLEASHLKELCNNVDDISIKKYVLQYSDKILATNRLFNPLVPEKQLKWDFPSHAIEYINKYKDDVPGFDDTEKFSFFNFVLEWYNMNCCHNDPLNFSPANRKRGLLIYGNRGIGKTSFFMNFCGVYNNFYENPYIIYCRNTLDSLTFMEKKDTAQLIILDDITYIRQQKEMIKGLCAGQPVTLRSLYVDNMKFQRCCPVVILTNNLDLFQYFLKSPEFNEDLDICGIHFYIGPPDTVPKRQIRHFISEAVNLDLDIHNGNKEKKKNNFNNYNIFK